VDDDSLQQVTAAVAEILRGGGPHPTSLTVRAGGVAIELEWDAQAPGSPPAPLAELPADDTDYIRSPAVGVFYLGPAPEAPPFVTAGESVAPGRQVGIIEVMKLMLPVRADRAGVIGQVLKKDGESVEFDEPLFELTVELTAELIP
jgi:acetyl-CoA carboxylase biotin carboxyl carrier protein